MAKIYRYEIKGRGVYTASMELLRPSKEGLINHLLEELKKDVINGDLTVLEELLGFIPVKFLIGALNEDEWKRYEHLKK